MSGLNWIAHDGGPMPVPGDAIVRVNTSPDGARWKREDVLPFHEYGNSDTAAFWNSGGRSWWEGDGGQITEYAVVGTLGEPEYADTSIDAHYTKLKIEPMTYSMENGLDPMQHTVIKYVTRFRDKHGKRDLLAARHVIDMMIDREYGE